MSTDGFVNSSAQPLSQNETWHISRKHNQFKRRELAMLIGMMRKQIAIYLILLLLTSFASANAEKCSSIFLAASKHAIHMKLAQQAGLHYMEKQGPGFSRQGTKEDGFQFFDPSGKLVLDEGILTRIANLKIPPAWENVWISVDPLSHVQARGNDSRKRPQARYHEIWNTDVKDIAKFERMERFGYAISKLRAAVSRDLNKPVSNPDSRSAAVVRLLEIAGIRIGGEKYALENEHFGLTTLQVRHVIEIKNTHVTFSFFGKGKKLGVEHVITVKDAEIARLIYELVKGKSPTDLVFDVNQAAVNKYIKDHSSKEFSAKDFRTWVGTVTAAKILMEIEPAHNEQERERIEKLAATAASERLGNEPDTAADHYIDPYIFEVWRSGQLRELAIRIKQRNANSERPIEETVVLELLKERETRH